MKRKRIFGFPAVFLGIILCLLLSFSTGAQNNQNPKRKKFGSSLKDPQPTPEPDKSQTDSSRQSDETITLRTTLAVFDLMVTDGKNRCVAGLTKADFIVYEDGIQQEIGTLSLGDDVELPRNIILIMDHSFSQFSYLESSIQAAIYLVSQMGPKDQMAIISDDVKMVWDFTRDKKKLIKGLNSLKINLEVAYIPDSNDVRPEAFGKSFQFSAVMAALRELTDSSEGRTIFIVQSDGDELLSLKDMQEVRKTQFPHFPLKRTSAFGMRGLLKEAEQSQATIYSVIPGEALIDKDPEKAQEINRKKARMYSRTRIIDGKPRTEIDSRIKEQFEWTQAGQLAMADMAAISGGWTGFLQSPNDAAEIYRSILTDINNRCIIGYYPAETRADGRRRRVRIEVRGHPEYTVQSRHAYYGSATTRR